MQTRQIDPAGLSRVILVGCGYEKKGRYADYNGQVVFEFPDEFTYEPGVQTVRITAPPGASELVTVYLPDYATDIQISTS